MTKPRVKVRRRRTPWDEPPYLNRKDWNSDPVESWEAYQIFPVLDCAIGPYTGAFEAGCMVKIRHEGFPILLHDIVTNDVGDLFGTVREPLAAQGFDDPETIGFERKHVFRMITAEELKRAEAGSSWQH